MQAGRLDRRCAFERRDETPDEYGNASSGNWVALATLWGDLRFERGRERVEAGRMESALSAVLTIRSSVTARGITPADRVTIDGAVYAIRTIAETPRSGAIEMTIERGVAP